MQKVWVGVRACQGASQELGQGDPSIRLAQLFHMGRSIVSYGQAGGGASLMAILVCGTIRGVLFAFGPPRSPWSGEHRRRNGVVLELRRTERRFVNQLALLRSLLQRSTAVLTV